MTKFIGFTDVNGKKRIVNVDYIEEIIEIDENSCCIYMAFNCPNAIEQDYFIIKKPYKEMFNVLKA